MADPTYNAMQQAAGLLPQPPPAFNNPVIFPGMVSANMAMGGQGGFGAGVFPTQQWQTFTNGPLLTQGPTGIMMPGQPSAPYNPYAPFGLGSTMPVTPRLYGPAVPAPPPAYAGPQGRMSPFFGPSPAPSYFETPFQAMQQHEAATQDRYFRGVASGYGMLGRLGMDAIGATVGGALGSRFGLGRYGAALGGAASEYLGAGSWAQNATMDNLVAPAVNMRAYGAGVEHLSRGFIAGGEYGHVSGGGLSHSASLRTARMLEDLASSNRFQNETQERFNRADVMKITQLGGREGLLDGAQNPDQLVHRVRDLAKSLSSFMELANEPDVQRAVETMGRMRSSGLNFNETLRAVSNGRAWARMAGTTFENLSAVGGSMGSQTYGAMGLSQGLGFQVGMGNYALARNAHLSGAVSPQMMALMGGAEGAAGLSTMFSGSFLQMPMLAPGLMNARGGLDASALQRFMGGRSNVFDLTSNATSNLSGMTRGMGIEGLGMAIALQPLMQDSIGRAMEAQGPFARRGVEDQQIMNLMRRMGHTGASGYIMAGQVMGLDRTQALARASELSSSDHYDRQRDQIEANRRERRVEELRDLEANRPGVMDDIAASNGAAYGARELYRGVRRGVRNFYEDVVHGTPWGGTTFGTRDARDRYENYAREHGLDALGRASRFGSPSETDLSWVSRFQADRAIYDASGSRGWLLNAGSATSATFGDEHARFNEIRGMRQLGRAGQNLLNTSSAEGIAAQRFLAGHGVSNDALLNFGATVGGISNNPETGVGGVLGAAGVNMAVRGGTAFLSGGMLDPGNISGARAVSASQLRNAFISSMRGQGWDAQQAGSYYDNNQTSVLQGASAYAGVFMGDRGLSRWNDMIQSAQRLGGGQTFDLERAERSTYGRLLGGGAEDVRERRALDRLTDSAQGVGRGDTNNKTRRALAAIRALQTQLDGPDGGTARTRMQEIIQEATQGLSEQEKMAFLAQAHIRNNRSRNDEETRRIGGHILGLGVSGQEVLSRFGASEEERNQETFVRRFRMGAESFGGQGGSLGELYRGATDLATFQQNVARVAGDEGLMSGLDESTRGLVRSAAGGDRTALNRLAQRGANRGRQGENAEQRYDSRWYARLFSLDQSVFDSKDDFRRKEMSRGTAADRDAERSELGVEDTQSQARSEGLGGELDQFREVTRNLRSVTHNLARVVESHGVDALMGDEV